LWINVKGHSEGVAAGSHTTAATPWAGSFQGCVRLRKRHSRLSRIVFALDEHTPEEYNIITEKLLQKYPEIDERFRRFLAARLELVAAIHDPRTPGHADRRLGAILNETKLRQVLSKMRTIPHPAGTSQRRGQRCGHGGDAGRERWGGAAGRAKRPFEFPIRCWHWSPAPGCLRLLMLFIHCSGRYVTMPRESQVGFSISERAYGQAARGK